MTNLRYMQAALRQLVFIDTVGLGDCLLKQYPNQSLPFVFDINVAVKFVIEKTPLSDTWLRTTGALMGNGRTWVHSFGR
jgi:hypothetical protein